MKRSAKTGSHFLCKQIKRKIKSVAMLWNSSINKFSSTQREKRAGNYLDLKVDICIKRQ